MRAGGLGTVGADGLAGSPGPVRTGGTVTRYDTIGRGYTANRRTDPRIAVAIHRALRDASSVVNVA
jgi:hypothetical protein